MYVCQKYMKIGFWTYTTIALLSLATSILCLTLLLTRHFDAVQSTKSEEMLTMELAFKQKKRAFDACINMCNQSESRLNSRACEVCMTEIYKSTAFINQLSG